MSNVQECIDRDLRDTPRRIGNVAAWVGERLELAGLWLQRNAAELSYRKWRAIRRWGK